MSLRDHEPPRPKGSPWAYILSYEAGLDISSEQLLTLAKSSKISANSTLQGTIDLQRSVERASTFIGSDLRIRKDPAL